MGVCGTREIPVGGEMESQPPIQLPQKLILLGPANSGKTTFFKQLIEHYSPHKITDHPKAFTLDVYRTVLTAIQTLVKNSKILGDESPECAIKKSPYWLHILSLGETLATCDITTKESFMINDLWEDEGIQNTFKRRGEFYLSDSAEYFLKKIGEIGCEDYVPTREDIMRAHINTTDITEARINVFDTDVHVCDVGGLRTERAKWIQVFEDVTESTCVIFFVSISEFDQTISEDDSVNSIEESLALFELIRNSRWFKDSKLVLFLNKTDLLQDKLNTCTLSEAFEHFGGSKGFETACKQFELEFRERQEDTNQENLFVQRTCVTDNASIETIVEKLKAVIAPAEAEGGKK